MSRNDILGHLYAGLFGSCVGLVVFFFNQAKLFEFAVVFALLIWSFKGMTE